MGRLANFQGWINLGEISFSRDRDGLRQLKAKLRQNQVLRVKVTRVISGRQAQINVKGIEALCDTPYELKQGSQIYIQVKELGAKVVLKMLQPGESEQVLRGLKRQELSGMLKSFNLPLNDENIFIAEELVKNGENVSAEVIREIRQDLMRLVKEGVLRSGGGGNDSKVNIIKLLIFLRGKGVYPSSSSLTLALKAFLPGQNLTALVNALMSEKNGEYSSLQKMLRGLIIQPDAKDAVNLLARQLADLGWFYEKKLAQALKKGGSDYTADFKYRLGKLISLLPEGDKNGKLQKFWQELTARSLKNLPNRNLANGESYFPFFYREGADIAAAHLKVAYSKEKSRGSSHQDDDFCFTLLLEMSSLGPMMLIAEIKKRKEVNLDFWVASPVIKKLLDSRIKDLFARMEGFGFTVKRLRSLVKKATWDNFLQDRVATRWQRWEKLDVLV